MSIALRIWGGKKRHVELPMFPSYLFVYLDSMEKYYDVMHVDGVLYYVKFGKQIAKISDTIINNIRLVESQRTVLEITDEHFLPGRQVMIKQGTLRNLSAEIVETQGKEKILIRVNLLQRNILMALPKEYITTVVA